jgi:6-pyruvoyl-tetrahydropterin synthase
VNVLFAAEVRDHIMIAHSLHGSAFGPAQTLHGATFIVAVAFIAEALNRDSVVVDIGRAQTVLKDVLAPLNYRNLDELAEVKGENTTTEFLAKYIFDRVADAVRSGLLGRNEHELQGLRVTISESHVARAWYEGNLR